MADFFGGILDSIRGVGDDVEGFFDSSIGQAVGKGIIGLTKKDEKKNGGPGLRDSFVEREYAGFSPRQAPADLKSEDYYAVEVEWLKRFRKFASMDTGTDVKIGGK